MNIPRTSGVITSSAEWEPIDTKCIVCSFMGYVSPSSTYVCSPDIYMEVRIILLMEEIWITTCHVWNPENHSICTCGYLPYQLVNAGFLNHLSGTVQKKHWVPSNLFAESPIRPGHRMDHLAIVQHLFGRLMHLPWHLAIGVEVGGPGWWTSATSGGDNI